MTRENDPKFILIFFFLSIIWAIGNCKVLLTFDSATNANNFVLNANLAPKCISAFIRCSFIYKYCVIRHIPTSFDEYYIKKNLISDIPIVSVQRLKRLNLCSAAASKCLPNQLEKLLKDIYCFFSTSAKLQKRFKEFQEHFGTIPHKMIGLSATRWLFVEAVVERTLEQWQPLEHFFFLFSFEDLRESNATNILQELNSTNKAYFLFFKYILNKINILNKTHQSKGTLIHLLYSQMERFF